MRREDRAKQFLPFDAMKGLAAAMKRQEERLARTERRDLGEEDAAAISSALSHLTRGENATATYYDGAQYREVTGVVTKVDEIRRTLTIGETAIAFDDLSALSVLPSDD
ncbi:MAG: YolD-like family protein [Clostridia bacterium]|nr:YolD-like family protein [Clostridia bacterium]